MPHAIPVIDSGEDTVKITPKLLPKLLPKSPWESLSKSLAIALIIACRLALANPSPTAPEHDVIVVGSEPEAISAAVAAAESGARTLLVSEDDRLGGLFVLGELNVLDLRTTPHQYQQGLFLRWWRRVGLGTSFDVERAEHAFRQLLEQAGVEVVLGAPAITPYPLIAERLQGVRVGGIIYRARQLIDGTADMTLATAAGAGFTVGFASLGYRQRMADTLVFRVAGVDWQELGRAIRSQGKSYAVIDDHVAWGSFGGYPATYQPLEPDLRLRGLNLGLQDDGTVLINALLIHGIDPFDPASLAAGRARAEREAPRIVRYLARGIPGFEAASYSGAAERLYVRESRHLQAECTLTVNDILDNRVTPQDIAAGGYPLDVQPLTPSDTGFVFGAPEIYGVRLCVTIPQGIDDLWVVGRSAGFDPLAAASARVVPFGMAVAEAVGVAAARAAQAGMSPRQYADDPAAISALRANLRARGAYLPPIAERPPVGPNSHPYYQDYRLLLSHGLAVGGYGNDPQLTAPVSELSYIYMLSNVGERFLGVPDLGRRLLATISAGGTPLTGDLALEITVNAACLLNRCPAGRNWEELVREGLSPRIFGEQEDLKRGDMYALAARIARLEPPAPAP